MSVPLVVEIAVSVILGGLVGWITNAVAINMLFKKYWRWGGVIETNYREFIDSMSALVEDDLVNAATLAPEFNAPAFKNVLTGVIEDIINRELPAGSGAIRLEKIPGAEASVNALAALLESLSPGIIRAAWSAAATRPVSGILSEEQYRRVVTRAVAVICADAGRREGAIKNAVGRFLADKTAGALVSGAAVERFADNAAGVIRRTDAARFDADIDAAWETIIGADAFNAVIRELARGLGAARLRDFVNVPDRGDASPRDASPGEASPHDVSRRLVTRLAGLIDAPEGREALASVIRDLLKAARGVDTRLSDVASPGFNEKITRFCREKMPGVIDGITAFVRQSRDEIEEIVNDTVDAELNATAGGKIGIFLKDVFVSNLAARVNVIDRINGILEQRGGAAGDKLAGDLKDALETKTVGEIAGALEKAGVISAESVAGMVTGYFRGLAGGKNAGRQSGWEPGQVPGRIAGLLDGLLDRRVDSFGGVTSQVIESAIRSRALPLVVKKIKTGYLYTERFKRGAAAAVTGAITDLSKQPLEKTFDVYNLPVTLNAGTLQKTFLKAWDAVGAARLGALFGETAPGNLVIGRDVFTGIWEEHKGTRLDKIYGTLRRESVYQKTAGGLIKILNDNLDALLAGRVSRLVSAELGELSPGDINALARDFMGREMKAINALGAALGALAGGAAAWGVSRLGLPGGFQWPLAAAYAAVFALVGVGTNWLAIKMLFRPYRALFPKLRFPPFLGVVAANKPRFARDIGELVRSRLLGGEALQKVFASGLPEARRNLAAKAAASNYAVVDFLLAAAAAGAGARRAALSGHARAASVTWLREHRREAAGGIAAALRRFVDAGKLRGLVPGPRDALVKKAREADLAGAAAGLFTRTIAGKRLGDVDHLMDWLREADTRPAAAAAARGIARRVTPEAIRAWLRDQNGAFAVYVSSHSLEDLAGAAAVDDAAAKLAGRAGPLVRDGVKKIIERIRREEFNQDTRLGDLFHGALTTIVERNIGGVIDAIIDAIRDAAGSIKGELADAIKADLPFYALPWKGHVDPIVDALIDERLPEFLRRKREMIVRIITGLLDYRLGDLGFDGQPLNMEKMGNVENMEKIVNAALESPAARGAVAAFVTSLARRFSKLPLADPLRVINIATLDDVIRIIDRPLIEPGARRLSAALSDRGVIDALARLLRAALVTLAGETGAADLLRGVDLAQELRRAARALQDDDRFWDDAAGIIDDALAAVAEAGDVYDDAILRRDLEACIGDLLDDRDFMEAVEPAVEAAFEALLRGVNAALAPETKAAVINALIDAALAACGRDFDAIIGAIDARAVVEREINRMNPREVETLFYRFAGTYFRKITFYGWIGAAGGPLGYAISLLLKGLF